MNDKMPPEVQPGDTGTFGTFAERLLWAEQGLASLRQRVFSLEQLGQPMPSTTNEERLAIIEREIATLRQRVSALEHPGMPQ